MRRLRFRFAPWFLMIGWVLFATRPVMAQSLTTGELAGVVRDASGAVLPGVPVSLHSDDKGFDETAVTNAAGAFRFPLLAPGHYTVSASAAGFQSTRRKATVVVGQSAVADLPLAVQGTETRVEVTSEAPLLQTQDPEMTTSLNARQVAGTPNPGNDLTYLAQTAPGAVMNTQSGWGKFSSFGLPATSNLFTLDGMYDNDPFQNVNNSGAANLLLGINEVQEASIVSNGYSGEYGSYAGAHVNYVTRSGSNAWHGNANYWWNGRVLNANDWFNKNVQAGQPVTPRAFDNANQYAAAAGGPIVKDKAFFFVNYEGLRVVIPTSAETLVPSTQFEQATLANLAASGLSQSIPFYQTMFNLYNNAPGISRAVSGVPDASDASGCGGFQFASSQGTLGAGGLPCAREFRSTAGNFTREYLLSGRFDVNLGSRDRLFLRLQQDKGLQATYTDPISPLFNAQSDQPQYQAQISENHVFGARAVNNLVVSTQYYGAVFQQPDPAAALAAFPTTMLMGDFTFDGIGGGASQGDYFWPQGRNVTSYQLLDDFSYGLSTHHTLKVGASFHRSLVSDHDYGFFHSGLVVPFTIADFYAGGVGPFGDELVQFFPSSLDQPIKLYQLGWYAQDEWKAKPNLKLTFAVRLDHNSNPVCGSNCFARFSSPFQDLSHDSSIPYNQAIVTGLGQALPSFTAISVQPRFGFVWQPLGLQHTVVRGGAGIFMDSFPATIADSLSSNPPLLNPFVILGMNGVPGFNYAIAPQQTANGAVDGNLFAVAANSNASFLSAFNSGGTLGSISSANPFFFPPSFNNASNVVAPTYQEWNVQVQQAFGEHTSVSVNYLGNHGIHEAAQFNGLNAYCPASVCPFGFAGLPGAPPDARFGTVNEIRSAAVSNYNGLTFSAVHQFAHGLQLQANYTWSHALDEISNGGFLQFNYGTNASLLNPVSNSGLRQYNYGNADYDARHSFTASYLWAVPKGPSELLKGWQVSGVVFKRSGLPYTVVDTATSQQLGGFNYGGGAYANFLGGAVAGCSTPKQPCLDAGQFSSPIALAQQGPAGFGTQRRNQFYGPGFFDTDMSLVKNTKLPGHERAQLGFGVQMYNLFNHPNFDQPVNDISDSRFGQIVRTVSTPTSLLGSGLGGDSSPRMVQLLARFSF